MLSGVLSSPRAIAVNIEITRTFVALRRALALNDEIAKRLALVEATLDQHRAEFATMTTVRQRRNQEVHVRHCRTVQLLLQGFAPHPTHSSPISPDEPEISTRSATETGAALAEHDQHIRIVFETIRRLMADDEPKPPARVGFDLD